MTGSLLRHQADGLPGDPDNPVVWWLPETKFRDAMSFPVNPVSDAKLDQAIAMIHDLENLKGTVRSPPEADGPSCLFQGLANRPLNPDKLRREQSV